MALRLVLTLMLALATTSARADDLIRCIIAESFPGDSCLSDAIADRLRGQGYEPTVLRAPEPDITAIDPATVRPDSLPVDIFDIEVDLSGYGSEYGYIGLGPIAGSKILKHAADSGAVFVAALGAVGTDGDYLRRWVYKAPILASSLDDPMTEGKLELVKFLTGPKCRDAMIVRTYPLNRLFDDYAPERFLPSVTCPAYIGQAEFDSTSPCMDNLIRISEYLPASDYVPRRIVMYPGLDDRYDSCTRMFGRTDAAMPPANPDSTVIDDLTGWIIQTRAYRPGAGCRRPD